jgi:hypothetical protein
MRRWSAGRALGLGFKTSARVYSATSERGRNAVFLRDAIRSARCTRQQVEAAMIHQPAGTQDGRIEILHPRVDRTDDVQPQHPAHQAISNVQE